MKITAKVDYACRALIELGLHWPNKSPLQIHAISKQQKIPAGFLIHILITLKHLGFVESTRGKSGGYFLKRSPADITLWDIISQFDGTGLLATKSDGGLERKITEIIWREIDSDVQKKMRSMTLLNICEKVRSQNKTLLYEI